MSCSIIIPTYNSATVLPYTLRALMDQKLNKSSDIEILICDDGSTDDTVTLAEQWAKKGPYRLRVLSGQHGGSAVARNRGIAHATQDILLFLGADIILLPGALEAHLHFHQQHVEPEQAALGFLQWDPRLKPSPLMQWMIHGGSQNDYDALLGTDTADARHFFYGAFISVKRSFLGTDLFSEDFHEYGWEDLELGRRLYTRGLKLSILLKAHALHRHFYTTHAISRRQQSVGRGLVEYQAKYPHERLLPPQTPWKKLVRYVVIHTGGVWLLRQLVTVMNTAGFSIPRLFLAYQSLELWTGILKRVKVFPT